MSRSPLSLRSALLIAALALTSLPAHAAVGDGFWHTDGNQIKDAAGNVVRFSGVNWHGMDSENRVPHGLWGQEIAANVHTIQDHLDQMKAANLNLIRLAFSAEILEPGRMPVLAAIDPTKNADIRAMSCIQILDRVIELAGARGIRIILDYHRLTGGGNSENGRWYDNEHSEAQWIANWKMLATRYRTNTTVVGADLFNEVHAGVTWEADNVNPQNNWRWAAKRCANEILAIHPDWLICVQGLDSYNGTGGWWGAVHLGVKAQPLTLNVANRLVYEIHDYGPVVHDQPFHQGANFAANLPAFWDSQWGFLHKENIAPVWIGEWGSYLGVTEARDMKDLDGQGKGKVKDILAVLENENPGNFDNYANRGQREIDGWFPAMRDYIKANNLSWTWWCWTPESRDTGGLLKYDYAINQPKIDRLASVSYAGFAPSGPVVVPPGNRPPTAMIGGTPTSGAAPLVVAFSAAGSADPDGDPLTYAWAFGDGANGTGHWAASHTYAAAGTFTVTLTVSDNHAHSATATTVITVTGSGGGGGGGPVIGTGTGLLGTYYDNQDFTGTSKTRTDAAIDFAWGEGAPIAGIANDSFSVRWTGKVQAQYSELYTFTTTSDDGVRLWVDGQLIIDDWHSHGAEDHSGTITLVAGQKYDLKLEYFDDALGATIALKWKSATTTEAVIPGSQIYPDVVAPPVVPPGTTPPGNQESSSGKCGVGSGLAVLLLALALALSLRLARRPLG